ncbi:HNH endonuclease [Zooshikella sp. RANM57]|uniref:HNH endonuclease n=1 Tax=Zooshikella sp. RANM57 TaxID=3425863 RepID=UPI003D6FF7C1
MMQFQTWPILALIIASNVYSHRGGLDAMGGHTDSATGQYHCHTDTCFSMAPKVYDRKNWKHWTDEDHDCQDTREEVLIRDAEQIGLSPRGCKVTYGVWQCPYTGLVFSNPSDLDIDHIVPLKEAFRSGASLWNAARKREFANDLENLLAVSNSTNRQKGDKDPTHWMPENWYYQ